MAWPRQGTASTGLADLDEAESARIPRTETPRDNGGVTDQETAE
jgi:hypothetical protein